MTAQPVVIIGDCLLDVDVVGQATRLTPDAPAPVLEEQEVRPRPGGAGLAALLLAGDGRRVTLITALADDDGGRQLAAMLRNAGVDLVDLGLRGATPEKIRLRAAGRSLARLDRGGTATAADVGPWTAAGEDALAGAAAVLVSCYGRGITGRDDVRAAVQAIATRRPVVWDPHPRGAEPVAGTTIATPNRAEAAHHAALPAAGASDGASSAPSSAVEQATRLAEALVARWRLTGCAVTLGAGGALYSTGEGMPLVVPAPDVGAADPCGAGDRFATCVAGQLADGRTATEAITDAVYGAAAFVAAGGASSVRLQPQQGSAGEGADAGDAVLLARSVAACGGTVVATGGCFDILHTGHIQLLQSARQLGDCLIVCLNSDDSVRRLKGPERPINAQEDRAAVLLALGCVDAVVIFEEDTPVPVLQRLQPHIFAKGGDYVATRIPEADALRAWGGRAVTLPYLAGRSTTQLIREVRQHADT